MRLKHQLNGLKKQKQYYSGKKKRHTLKTQLAINLKNMQIVDLAFSNGKKHDFKLFKKSCFHVKPNSTIIADSAYQGLHKIHSKANPRIYR